jgi:hypothetical protein
VRCRHDAGKPSVNMSPSTYEVTPYLAADSAGAARKASLAGADERAYHSWREDVRKWQSRAGLRLPPAMEAHRSRRRRS